MKGKNVTPNSNTRALLARDLGALEFYAIKDELPTTVNLCKEISFHLGVERKPPIPFCQIPGMKHVRAPLDNQCIHCGVSLEGGAA